MPAETTEKSLPPPWDRIFSLATRTFVWGLLIAVLYLLRPFLLLVFLTFVFAYIQAHGVEGLSHRIKNRPLRVVIVGLVFLGTLFATGFTLLPQVQDQASQFLSRKDAYIKDADAQLNKTLRQYPSIYDALAKHSTAQDLTALVGPSRPGELPRRLQPPPPPPPPPAEGTDANGAPGEGDVPADGAPREGEVTTPPPNPVAATPAGTNDGSPRPNGSPVAQGEAQAPPAGVRTPQELHLIRDLVDGVGEALAKNPLEIGQSVLTYASSFLLSLLFSFLIVLDLRKITRGVQGLAHTRIGFIYDEVADNIAGFGRVLGRALEAQLFIAVCNTILTFIGIWMMDLPNLLVLSTIVFFCSFIPVVGTFISSTPICLLALQQGGVTSMALAILMITVIHMVETYVLNPQIYGHHMHMNPVLVLIVLTIGGKLFGIWGLILGIPIVNYVFRHAIRRPEERPVET